MIKDSMAKALNNQIKEEMYSAYLYMAMSADASDKGLNGVATWFMTQYHEEMFHAMKIYEFLQDRGAKVKLQQIKEPPADFKNVKEMFDGALEHEEYITGCINDLVDQARKENDHATDNFLQWYVEEQVEEEKNVHDILDRINLMDNVEKGNGLVMFDKELAGRTVGTPTDFSVEGFSEQEDED
jgi:ferritin